MKTITPTYGSAAMLRRSPSSTPVSFTDSRIERLMSSPAENPSAAKGELLLVVELTLNGQKFLGVNGGPIR